MTTDHGQRREERDRAGLAIVLRENNGLGPIGGQAGQIAQEVIPQNTILLLTTWRQQAFDIDYPDYTPDPVAVTFIARARQYGFRIMLHVNLLGVSQTNPNYPSMQQCQIKTADELKPIGWLWDELPDGDFNSGRCVPASTAAMWPSAV